MPAHKPQYIVKIAETADELHAAQRLRYDVFVKELKASGPLVDHAMQLERDYFDDHAVHLLLCDAARLGGDQVVGTYRLMTSQMAAAAGGFYCASEFDLTPVLRNGGKLLELGRSCLHRDYRGGDAMVHLWAGLSDFVDRHGIDTLFGVASFHGTNVADLMPALALLQQRHLAPPQVQVRAQGATAVFCDLPEAGIDRVAAVRMIPALIKGYLRLGGTVGAGAFVDHDFNTTDICLILQRDAMIGLQRQIYTKGGRRGRHLAK